MRDTNVGALYKVTTWSPGPQHVYCESLELAQDVCSWAYGLGLKHRFDTVSSDRVSPRLRVSRSMGRGLFWYPGE